MSAVCWQASPISSVLSSSGKKPTTTNPKEKTVQTILAIEVREQSDSSFIKKVRLSLPFVGNKLHIGTLGDIFVITDIHEFVEDDIVVVFAKPEDEIYQTGRNLYADLVNKLTANGWTEFGDKSKKDVYEVTHLKGFLAKKQ